MAWTYSPIRWDNDGTEPSESLKTNGFQAGYKPPAPVFNKFISLNEDCINELQQECDKKVTAESGKGLSTNDFTNDYKDLLDNFETTMVNKFSTAFLDLIMPVGFIFQSFENQKPSLGTWEACGQGRVLVGVGTSDKAFSLNAEGGASTVKLTASESGIREHNHTGIITVDAGDSMVTGGSTSDHTHRGKDNKYFLVDNDGKGVTEHKVASGETTTNRYLYVGDSTDVEDVDRTGGQSDDHGHHYEHGHSGSVTIDNCSSSSATSAHNNLQPYKVVYMFKRTA